MQYAVSDIHGCYDRHAIRPGRRDRPRPGRAENPAGHGPPSQYISVWNQTGTSTKNGVTYETGSWVGLDSTARGYGPTYKPVQYYG